MSTRHFEYRRLWRVTPQALDAAVRLICAQQPPGSLDAVVGIARGGLPASRGIAGALGLPVYSVVARHNLAGTVFEQATGLVTVEDDGRSLEEIPAGGRLLLVDDICASGATLHAVAAQLHARCSPASIRTAVLCRNTAADVVPDTVVWDGIADWVLFPGDVVPDSAPPVADLRIPIGPVPIPAGAFTIGKAFDFEAGHRLPGLPPGHKCAEQHGHSYKVEVILTAPELEAPGFVTDFGELAPFKAFLNTMLDHTNLHEILPIEPTSERLAQFLAGWFIENVEPTIPGHLVAVRVRETERSWAQFDVEPR